MNTTAIPIVQPPEELTDETVEDFETLMDEHLQAGGPGVVIDLLEVSFISSAGLGCLVKFGMRLDRHGRRLALARPDPNVEKSVRLIRLESKLPMFPSVSEAAGHIASLA